MASKRFPPPSESLADFENEVYKAFGANPTFKYKDDTGAPIGPWSVMAYTPDLFPSFMSFSGAMFNQKGLTERERELAILAVTAVYTAPFISYAHTKIAGDVGLSSTQIEEAKQGTVPNGLNDTENVLYETALQLAKSRGPLSEPTWEKASSVLGKEKCARVANVVGFYVSIALLMAMGDVGAPEK